MKKVKKVLIGALLFLSFGVFLSFNDDVDFEIVKNLDIYYSLFRELNVYYVDEINPSDLVKKSIDAMLNSLDPYTVYIPENQIEDLRFMTTGQYGGVGALIQQRGEEVMISEVYESYPAQLAGLTPGDILLEMDGKSLQGKKVSEVSEMLKGQAKTQVKIKVRKAYTNEIKEYTLTREEIKLNNVPYYGIIEDKIGYIYLANFTEKAASEVSKAVMSLKEQGAEKLILDLRGNPGGLLMEAVQMMSLFVPKGTLIVSTKGRVKEWEKSYYSTINPIDTSMPIVVLVNNMSASASEIIAGAMQDLDRGVILGQRTFGKGLVQTTRDLSYNAKLKVTTAKYYTPAGRCIQAIDYSHRNPDGSVGKIPDSLVNEFKTKSGRIVYDGGGIKPDIELEPENLSPVAQALIENNIIFDFASKFYATNTPISSLNNVFINEKVYKEFIDFASSKSFSYKTESEKVLDQLIESLKKDKYYDLSKEDIDHLVNKIKKNKELDFQLFQEQIQQLLFEEIAERYFYQKGRILATLRNDPAMNKAKEILNDIKTYRSLLKSNK